MISYKDLSMNDDYKIMMQELSKLSMYKKYSKLTISALEDCVNQLYVKYSFSLRDIRVNLPIISGAKITYSMELYIGRPDSEISYGIVDGESLYKLWLRLNCRLVGYIKDGVLKTKRK